jgi:hypothetical protein
MHTLSPIKERCSVAGKSKEMIVVAAAVDDDDDATSAAALADRVMIDIARARPINKPFLRTLILPPRLTTKVHRCFWAGESSFMFMDVDGLSSPGGGIDGVYGFSSNSITL